jgi:hypothetical protein
VLLLGEFTDFRRDGEPRVSEPAARARPLQIPPALRDDLTGYLLATTKDKDRARIIGELSARSPAWPICSRTSEPRTSCGRVSRWSCWAALRTRSRSFSFPLGLPFGESAVLVAAREDPAKEAESGGLAPAVRVAPTRVGPGGFPRPSDQGQENVPDDQGLKYAQGERASHVADRTMVVSGAA